MNETPFWLVLYLFRFAIGWLILVLLLFLVMAGAILWPYLPKWRSPMADPTPTPASSASILASAKAAVEGFIGSYPKSSVGITAVIAAILGHLV